MKTEKEFDAVKMMREIRDKHHEEYESNPKLREDRLAVIRKKYAHRIKNTDFVRHQ
jgi:hypothetical protein